MAKAKKSQGSEKKPATKPAAGTSGGSPAIDTNLAAAAAARMLTARATGTTGSPRKETSMFKQMKESVAKPHSQSVSNVLDKSEIPGQKKSTQPFTHKQAGHAQTTSNFSKINVPRRTGG